MTEAAANPSLAERLSDAEASAGSVGAEFAKAIKDAVTEIELAAASRSATIGFLRMGQEVKAEVGARDTLAGVDTATKELTGRITNAKAYRLNVLDAIAARQGLRDNT